MNTFIMLKAPTKEPLSSTHSHILRYLWLNQELFALDLMEAVIEYVLYKQFIFQSDDTFYDTLTSLSLSGQQFRSCHRSQLHTRNHTRNTGKNCEPRKYMLRKPQGSRSTLPANLSTVHHLPRASSLCLYNQNKTQKDIANMRHVLFSQKWEWLERNKSW